MGTNVLYGKRMLAVDDEPDILEIIREELDRYGVDLDEATTYEQALQRLISYTYDLAILDIMGVRGFELLEVAANKKLPVVILTAHALSPESLKKSIQLGARAYVPKEKIDEIAPFCGDVLELSYESAWESLFNRLGDFFGRRFGPDWRKSDREFWDKFQKDMQVTESTIIQD